MPCTALRCTALRCTALVNALYCTALHAPCWAHEDSCTLHSLHCAALHCTHLVELVRLAQPRQLRAPRLQLLLHGLQLQQLLPRLRGVRACAWSECASVEWRWHMCVFACVRACSTRAVMGAQPWGGRCCSNTGAKQQGGREGCDGRAALGRGGAAMRCHQPTRTPAPPLVDYQQ